MIIKLKEKIDDAKWHKHFCLLPVVTDDGYLVWLRTVYKKRMPNRDLDIDIFGYSHSIDGWEYAVNPQ